jgi:uncharacterized membrane protein (DUF373 family)
MTGKDGPQGYSNTIAGYLEQIESAVYLLVSIFLIIMALMTFFIVGKDLSQVFFGMFNITTIQQALNDLLITLIIAELIQTVIVYIENHELDLKLILGAGITAMIRRVLLYGAESIPWEEMAITGLLIIVLVTAIYLIGDRKISIEQK